MSVKVRAWKGAWWIFIDHQGRRKAKRVGIGKEGHRAAQLVAEKIQTRLVLGDFSLLEEPRPLEITLQEYGHQWLVTDVALRLKPATAEKYGAILRKHWLPELGKLPLSGITREKVKTILQGKLMEGMKPNMARIMLTVLRACLYAAVEEGRLTGNPAARVGKFIGRARVEVDIFIWEELTRLLATAVQDMPEVYPLVLALSGAGGLSHAARALPLFGLDSAAQAGRLAVSQASHAASHRRVDADLGRGKPRVRERTIGTLVHDNHGGYLWSPDPWCQQSRGRSTG
jgi:integrase